MSEEALRARGEAFRTEQARAEQKKAGEGADARTAGRAQIRDQKAARRAGRARRGGAAGRAVPPAAHPAAVILKDLSNLYIFQSF